MERRYASKRHLLPSRNSADQGMHSFPEDSACLPILKKEREEQEEAHKERERAVGRQTGDAQSGFLIDRLLHARARRYKSPFESCKGAFGVTCEHAADLRGKGALKMGEIPHLPCF